MVGGLLKKGIITITKNKHVYYIVTPRFQNTYLVTYSDFSIEFFDLLPVFVLFYD